MATELVVVQHHPLTGPSSFREVLDARTSLVPWRLVDLDAGGELPEVDRLAGLVSLGGPMSVLDEEPAPWLDGELELLRAAVEAEVPVLAVGLGSQLLATALDGKVTRREVPQAAFLPLERTEAADGEPVTAGWPDGSTALLLRRDEVAALPDGAEPLLTGPRQPAAWRRGSGIGVAFHPEATVAQLEEWVGLEPWRGLLADAGVDAEQLLGEARDRERFMLAHGRSLIGRFIDDPVRKGLPD